jgi:hypothetical protein
MENCLSALNQNAKISGTQNFYRQSLFCTGIGLVGSIVLLLFKRGVSETGLCVRIQARAYSAGPNRYSNFLSPQLSCCDRRLVGLFVLVSGTPLGPITRFFLLPFFLLPLWREDGSVICSAMCQCSESRRTHNHTLLSHLSLSPESESLYGWQSVSMSWCRDHLVDVWPDITSFSRVWVWNFLSCPCGAPSLTRGLVCPL